MNLQENLNKVWECIESFDTEKERTHRRWVLKDRKENVQNLVDFQLDEKFNLRYEIWK
jgi:hypothetical protein